MRLIWIRHGETLWNSEFRLQGTSDVALSELGLVQSQRLAAAFRGELHKIYTSPLGRARSFAAPLAKRCKLEPIVVEELREMSFGRWEGLRYEDMDAAMQQAFAAWCSDPVNICPPEGESAAEMGKRVRIAVDKLTASMQGGEAVAMFTHGGVIRVAVTALMGLPPVTAARLRIDTGSITMMDLVGEHWHLVGLNDTSHLHVQEDC